MIIRIYRAASSDKPDAGKELFIQPFTSPGLWNIPAKGDEVTYPFGKSDQTSIVTRRQFIFVRDAEMQTPQVYLSVL